MILCQRRKGKQVIKSVRKNYKEVITKQHKNAKVSFNGNKLSSRFNIKDKTKFEHRHDVIYLRTCPETTCNVNYNGGAKRPQRQRL